MHEWTKHNERIIEILTARLSEIIIKTELLTIKSTNYGVLVLRWNCYQVSK